MKRVFLPPTLFGGRSLSKRKYKNTVTKLLNFFLPVGMKILNVYLVVFAINGIIIKYRLKNTLKKLKG